MPAESLPTVAQIKTVVVLVHENRSFDHMPSWMKSLNPAIDGVTGRESNPLSTIDPNSAVIYFSNRSEYVDLDPGHSIQAIYKQVYSVPFTAGKTPITPDIQSKAQTEIDAVVGDSLTVSDSDIPKLPYLQAIVKESLRVHPPGPLLSWARLATHDVNIGNHFIPAGTTAMVNMWTITHDESNRSEPGEFKPERFMAEDVSILGSDLRLAPFGSGRRVLPWKGHGVVYCSSVAGSASSALQMGPL